MQFILIFFHFLEAYNLICIRNLLQDNVVIKECIFISVKVTETRILHYKNLDFIRNFPLN